MLTMPVLAVGGENSVVGGPNITKSSVVYGMRILAQNVQGIIVPGRCGTVQHFSGFKNLRQLGNLSGDLCSTTVPLKSTKNWEMIL
jgi:hypothetical protein